MNNVRVTLPATCGVRAVGSIKPGETVTVSTEEAARLISCKGFVRADDEASEPKPQRKRAAATTETGEE